MTQRDDFVRCAREQVGKKYVWGTAGPDTFDCSGLVAHCYFQATRKTITRSSYGQFNLGKPTRVITPGTIQFWDAENNGTAGHVAISIGEGRVSHALNLQRGVIISDELAPMGGPRIGVRDLPFPDEENHPWSGLSVSAPSDSSPEDKPNPIKEKHPKARRRRRNRRKEAA